MVSSPSDTSSAPRPPSPPPDSGNNAATNDFTIDLALEDETLTALDKIYLFTTSKAPFHRIFITHSLHDFLKNVPPHDAIRYVLPLVSGLAMDPDEQVKEALAAELEDLIWWFFTNCQVVPDYTQTPTDEMSPSIATEISVQSFTPILGTLLLSPNPLVGGAARHCIVDLLNRLNQADEDEDRSTRQDLHQGTHPATGLFRREERACFRTEILQQIVIGMARLDFDSDEQYESVSLADEHLSPGTLNPPTIMAGQIPSPNRDLSAHQLSENINPYFPVDLATYHSELLRPKSPKSAQSPKSPLSPLDNINGALSHLSTTSSNHKQDPPRLANNITITESNPKSTGAQATRSPTEDRLAKLPPPGEHTETETVIGHRHEPEVAEIPMEIEDEHAAVGRLSSMSLMAAVAAGGYLDHETQRAFVEEVDRVGQDPIYWVRREASFALGALSKVVPEELVLCTLLPLFQKLRIDSSWHVRHSSLFALPAILSRLPRHHRRTLAIETLSKLASDEAKVVRSGVLESLGEVLSTFKDEDEGPPDKLLQMFLGRREDKRLRDGQQIPVLQTIKYDDSLHAAFYSDPDRPLICAFNFPAVALTLGERRWKDLRETYLELANLKSFQVQRTLAASLGELAKIVGPENARLDLLQVWRNSIRNQAEEVGTKAIEATPLFVQVLTRNGGDAVVMELVQVWDEGVFTVWRGREYIAKSLVDFMLSVSSQAHPAVVELLKRALEDGVASVREAAVCALPRIWNHMSDIQGMPLQLKGCLEGLANSDLSRRRMTFIACQQSLMTSEKDGRSTIPLNANFWSPLSRLAEDSIIDVRIGVARLVSIVIDAHHLPVPAVGPLADIITRLSHDHSRDVQSFVADLSGLRGQVPSPSFHPPTPHQHLSEFATFSRPPPVRVVSFPGGDLKKGNHPVLEEGDSKRPDYRITINSSSFSVAKSPEGLAATITIRDDSGMNQDGNIDYEVEAGVNLKPSIPIRA